MLRLCPALRVPEPLFLPPYNMRAFCRTSGSTPFGRLASGSVTIASRWASESTSFSNVRQANPHRGSTRYLKHWHMVAMCCGCTIAGFAAGQYAWVDEENLPARFDKEEVKKEIMKAIDFRPDLAATIIRTAFVFAAARGGHEHVLIQKRSESDADASRHAHGKRPVTLTSNTDEWSADVPLVCASAEGLNDVIHLLEFSASKRNQVIDVQDVAAIAVIAAVEFLGGPADRLTFHWGRSAKDIVPAAKGAAADKPVGSSSCPFHSPAVTSPTAGEGVVDIAIPGLTVEERVALLACHGVGQYHGDVSGVSGVKGAKGDAVTRGIHRYQLGPWYYQMLLKQEKALKPYAVPRTDDNKTIAVLPAGVLSAPIEEQLITGEGRKKRLVVLQGDVELLLRDKACRRITETFAADPEAWRVAFASAVQKMMDAHCHRLRAYPSGPLPHPAPV